MVRMLASCALAVPVLGNLGWGPIHLDLGSNTSSAMDVIQWTPTRPEAARRLDVEVKASHTNQSDANCIVGGFDADNPLKIYVGGPCSGLTVSGDTFTIGDNFKWLEMQTVYMQIGKGDTAAPFTPVPAAVSPPVVFPQDKDTHAEVAVGGSQYLKAAEMGHAAVFASTTSYLAKKEMKYTQNEFVTGKNGDGTAQKSAQCIAPCCSDPGANGCTCGNGCPTTEVVANPGDYKFSIMAAAYDFPSVQSVSEYKSGPNGNGWEKVVDTYGTGSPKQLAGLSMDIYQLIDFTNMKADTLTITPPTGAAVKYKDMTLCDMVGEEGCSNEYAVASVTVESDAGAWSGTYAFPMTSNVGTWTAAGTSTTVEATRKVHIHAVRPSQSTLTAWSLPKDNKIVLLRYRFDISGITASGLVTGKFMNYDPTITSGTGGTGGSGNQTDSAPSMHNRCGLAALVMILAGIASV